MPVIDAQVAIVAGVRSAGTACSTDFSLAGLERTFTIRINDGVAATLATAAAEATAAAAPGVTLRFVAEGSESTDALRDGSIDLDIGVGGQPAPDIRTAVLYRERLVAAVRADSPLGRHRRPTLAQLCRPSSGSGRRSATPSADPVSSLQSRVMPLQSHVIPLQSRVMPLRARGRRAGTDDTRAWRDDTKASAAGVRCGTIHP
jgi:DNA-binding transcriptional LysR family regulator